MKKKESQAGVRLELAADKAVISSEKGCRRILEVTITPPVHEPDRQRAPLNLALVLDRSGSMQGEKLHYARQAAAHVLDLLEEKDRAANGRATATGRPTTSTSAARTTTAPCRPR